MLFGTRDYFGEAWQASKFTVFGTLGQLAKDLQNGATPNNIFMFQSIESRLEQPVHDAIKAAHNKCVNKISALPGEIQNLSREDAAYHDALAVRSSLYHNPR
jgi:hypothetical protein